MTPRTLRPAVIAALAPLAISVVLLSPAAPAAAAPVDKAQCKRGGWQQFTDPAFKNQGACVRSVNGLSRDRGDRDGAAADSAARPPLKRGAGRPK